MVDFYSIIVAIAVGLAAGYLGSLMVLEKMALVGDALSHVALPGLALGILYGFNPFLGAFIFLFGSAMIIWYIQRFTGLSFETLVGATFTLALAIGIMLVPQPDLLEALFGDVSSITLAETFAAVLVAVLGITFTTLIRKQIVLGLISEELAVSYGVNIARINLLYLLIVSVIVAIGIRITGTLLVGFLVVTPAAAAKTVSSNLARYFSLSAVFGALSALSGIIVSDYLVLPPGPMVVFSGITIFVVVLIVRWIAKLSST